ncbi:zinc finger protein ztf-16-like [Ruditapes philippinarum]|uniref:zinc finger protein ztf-16-like n=1 Tax=Ruditapes philippinarum TaxID=129788 RepID=UPI00295B00F1|nr:zinc finger protein ztf-16-like [Ruditapes philippinarum]
METMNSNAVTVKVEPPDDFGAGTSDKVSSATLQNGTAEKKDLSFGKTGKMNTSGNDSRNFTCLLCDIVCDSRDDLRKHLKNAHASKNYSTMNSTMYLNKISSEATARAFSGYVNYRYTCPICGAKFKSFRTYLTHNMSHRGTSGLQPFDEARMAALFGTGKQYMQDYLEAEEGYAGTFSCNECKTVFVQRDGYAMHMMMRAMNGTCRTAVTMYENSPVSTSEETSQKPVSNGTDVQTTQSGEIVPTSTEQTNQRCLEDVTAKIDQDEYLKSVLDKVCASDAQKLDASNYTIDDRKMCSFCRETFVDQDSLAMHVMSDHANEMSSTTLRNNNSTRGANHDDYLAWMAVATKPMMMNCVCKYCNETFMSRDSLALHVLTHAHLEERMVGHSRNSAKRKSEGLDNGLSLLQPPKLLKYNEEFETNDHNGSTPPKVVQVNGIVDSNLYCEECDIKFYALSEYKWHKERHNNGDITNYDRPLCLSKKTERKYLPNNIESAGISFTDNNKRRRNSFSSTDTSKVCTQATDKLPQRPVSVGDCSRHTLKVLSKSHSEHLHTGNGENSSTLDGKSVLNTINSLSSSEQRIIYSVFGNDLGLKLENTDYLSENSRSRSCTPPVDLSSAKPKSPAKDARSHKTHGSDPNVSELTKTADPDENITVKLGDPNKPMCKYCEILFFNKAIYYLHMGLHNVNNPWQCNICGKICNDAVDFAAHVIHM